MARKRARHLEDDAHADPLVLLDEPCRDVFHLVHVHDGIRSERPRELHPERHVVGGEEPARAERLRDRDREESDRPASEDGHRTAREVLRRGREHRVAERLLQAGDLGRELRAVVPPDHRGRNGDVVREAPVTVDAEDLGRLAHVRLARPAVEAHAARHVTLRGDVVALGDVADRAPRRDDRPAELVPERERRLHSLGRPLVPASDVEVCSADRRGFDPDEDFVHSRVSAQAPRRARARVRTRAYEWRASSPRGDDLATAVPGGAGGYDRARAGSLRPAAAGAAARHAVPRGLTRL